MTTSSTSATTTTSATRMNSEVAAGRKSRCIHGLYRHALYKTWKDIKYRCYSPASKDYHLYGARGIKVYKPWIANPAAFVGWVERTLGARPKGQSLDRIKVNGNYVPGNLKWSTASEQRRNQRPRTKGFIGVRKTREGFIARISIQLGQFSDAKEAAVAYKKAVSRVQEAERILTS